MMYKVYSQKERTMKEKYEDMVSEVIIFNTYDVITASDIHDNN